MNPGQDLNYHAEAHLLDILYYIGQKQRDKEDLGKASKSQIKAHKHKGIGVRHSFL